MYILAIVFLLLLINISQSLFLFILYEPVRNAFIGDSIC